MRNPKTNLVEFKTLGQWFSTFLVVAPLPSPPVAPMSFNKTN